MAARNGTLGVIIGNRDFFPDSLIADARRDLAALGEKLGIEWVMLGEQDSKLGAVETWNDAKACAELFRRHRDRIDGVLITLPNFGDEKGVADTLKLAGLDWRAAERVQHDALQREAVPGRGDQRQHARPVGSARERSSAHR